MKKINLSLPMKVVRAIWIKLNLKEISQLELANKLSSIEHLTWEQCIMIKLIRGPLKEGYSETNAGIFRLGFTLGAQKALFSFLETPKANKMMDDLVLDSKERRDLSASIRSERIASDDFFQTNLNALPRPSLVAIYRKGYVRGLEGIINSDGELERANINTNTLLMLLLLRKEINRCKSVEEIYHLLKENAPETCSYDINSFKTLCSRIGLQGTNHRKKKSQVNKPDPGC